MESSVGQWNKTSLWRLVWPLMIEQLLAATIGMADTSMVTAVGESAVSGVALVDSINNLLIYAFSALATGGAVVASQYIGQRKSKQASQAARQLVYSILALSVLLMLVVLLLGQPILQLIFGNIDPDVMSNAKTYFWLSAVSYPFLALYNAGAALFRSMGNSRVGMFTALLVNILNIGGNSLMIFGFGWGVAGAAISTLISRAIAGFLIIRLLVASKQGKISLKGLMKPQLQPAMISSILKIGVPSGLESSMFQIGKLLVARLVSSFGTSAIAGNAIGSILASFCNLPGQAAGLALLTVVGQCIGAKDYNAAKKNTTRLMKFAFLGMAGIDLLILLSLSPLLNIFNLSPAAADVAYRCMVLYCITNAIFWPQSFSLPNALRAAGDAKYTLQVSIFSMWIFRIGFSYLLGQWLGLGVFGVWIAMVIDWVVRGTFFLFRWLGGKWQHKTVV